MRSTRPELEMIESGRLFPPPYPSKWLETASCGLLESDNDEQGRRWKLSIPIESFYHLNIEQVIDLVGGKGAVCWWLSSSQNGTESHTAPIPEVDVQSVIGHSEMVLGHHLRRYGCIISTRHAEATCQSQDDLSSHGTIHRLRHCWFLPTAANCIYLFSTWSGNCNDFCLLLKKIIHYLFVRLLCIPLSKGGRSICLV